MLFCCEQQQQRCSCEGSAGSNNQGGKGELAAGAHPSAFLASMSICSAACCVPSPAPAACCSLAVGGVLQSGKRVGAERALEQHKASSIGKMRAE